jgi:hypothetical protein
MAGFLDNNLHPYITDYLDNTMDRGMRSAFEALLARDRNLRRFVADVAGGRALLKRFSPVLRSRLIKTTPA